MVKPHNIEKSECFVHYNGEEINSTNYMATYTRLMKLL